MISDEEILRRLQAINAHLERAARLKMFYEVLIGALIVIAVAGWLR